MVFTRPAGSLIPLVREIPENDQDHDAGVKVRNLSNTIHVNKEEQVDLDIDDNTRLSNLPIRIHLQYESIPDVNPSLGVKPSLNVIHLSLPQIVKLGSNRDPKNPHGLTS